MKYFAVIYAVAVLYLICIAYYNIVAALNSMVRAHRIRQIKMYRSIESIRYLEQSFPLSFNLFRARKNALDESKLCNDAGQMRDLVIKIEYEENKSNINFF